jgi:hydrogenase large subunit
MDRIVARSLETRLICSLLCEWLLHIEPGPPPIARKPFPARSQAVSTVDSMRGALLHAATLSGEEVVSYDIITPSVWNFSPKSTPAERGPAEAALVGTVIPEPDGLLTVLGRIIRSFDPCLSCGTHVLDRDGRTMAQAVL